MRRLLALFLLVPISLSAMAQYAPANPEWNRRIGPFRIAGNLYHVGAANVSSFLITTPKGNILIDGGFRETAPIIEANIRALGLRVQDIRILLSTHEHFDHAGGLAALQKATHARLLANPAAVPLMINGGRGDFAFHDRFLFPPVKPDGVLKDAALVSLGGFAVVPHFTPGHTHGCTTWTMTEEQGGRPLHVVITCSLSAPDYQLVNNPAYPNTVADFTASIAKLRALPCDIFLTPHGWDFDLADKAKAVAGGKQDAFVDPAGYRHYLDKAEAAIKKQLNSQSSVQPPADH